VLAELNTHRVFSRNSASSRAIPTHKRIAQVLDDPAIPIEFGSNQAGMQAGAPIEDEDKARNEWLRARDAAVEHASALLEMGVHKQVVNRVLEPFMWHTVVISSTYWENFFDQRCSPLAQPEIRAFAEVVRGAIEGSEPDWLTPGEWHLPFTRDSTYADTYEQIRVSVARCARTSYETHDGEIDVAKDLELYQKLVNARPMHASPLEHVACVLVEPLGTSNFYPRWEQWRSTVEKNRGLETRR
jgi:thymidylate synthase ThyX